MSGGAPKPRKQRRFVLFKMSGRGAKPSVGHMHARLTSESTKAALALPDLVLPSGRRWGKP